MSQNEGMFYAPKGVSSKVIVSDQGYVCGMTRAFLDEIKADSEEVALPEAEGANV